MLLRRGGDRGARRTVGGGLLPLRKLPALFRGTSERVHIVEERKLILIKAPSSWADSRAATSVIAGIAQIAAATSQSIIRLSV